MNAAGTGATVSTVGMISVSSAACAALAVALATAPRPRAPVADSGSGRVPGENPRGGLRRRAVAVVLALVTALLVVGLPVTVVVLAGVLALAGAAGLRLLARRRERRAAQQTASRVLEVCEQVAGDLGAGQPPGAALERAAADWAPLGVVAQAFRVGADVPAAWREVAAMPGAHDLRVVAAAWQVAHRTGEGLADTVGAVARELRADQGTRRIVAGELASARSTAKLVAALPLLALAMGSGAGGDPWGFLLGEPLGLACLAGGLAFLLAGLSWIEAIARGASTAGR